MSKENKRVVIGYYNKSVILTFVGIIISIAGMLNVANTDFALTCLILAGVCDLFDGVIARKCKRTDKEKEFGVQIDSLADVISFLIFPVVFALFNNDNKIVATVVAGVYILAGIERLGWFNVNTAEGKTGYYDGLPVTYSALIIPIANVVLELLNIQFKYTNYILLILLAVLYIANVKIKKPTGVWYIIFSVLAVATIVVIHIT